MPPALGLLLVLPLVGALHQSDNEIFASRSNDSLLLPDRDYVSESRDFSVTEILPEGELRRVTRWNGLCAKETIVDWGDTSVALREVSLRDSRRKLQLIYEGDTLADCIDGVSPNDGDERCAFDVQTGKTEPGEARINIFENAETTNRSSRPELEWLGNVRDLRKRCDKMKSNARNFLMGQHRHRRIERSLQQMVIAPGTKWCGPHRTANSYKELGPLDHADRCCRRHDHCHRSIPPFSELYNLWNYMPFTLSHCGCDQSFRTCLKMAGTSSANFIGRIFFNVVQTKCFVLKPQKVCVRQSWWGKCEKHRYKKQAHLRDNVPY